ncbi:anthrax toxin-like adenylyl cyclase domain-containing protein [Aeromonas salmonicida]|uniref:anthrax toxin-like adenylyl cyclase domain-containing protein n=1 Tax=Aeromonas salmonicida TaxID=645 RepID=UPI00232AFDDF|nr:anthrax toxin-like adenylyl cyclase domain-containing protein [Aeromonas salmonicida]
MMRIDNVREVQPREVEQPKEVTRPAGLDHQAVKSLFTSHGVGVPVGHAMRMQAVAKEKNTVFGIRPVEGMVTTLIDEGYPTKGLSVKGKSANWGPQAGFICVEQGLSKRENRGEVEIGKLNQAVAKGMGNGYTQADLKISHQRIGELIEKFGLEAEGGGSVRLLLAQGPSGKPYEFVAKQEGDSHMYQISLKGEEKAIQVLADPKSGLPMTADYDLFMVAPPIEEYGSGGADARSNTAVKYKPLPNDPYTTETFYSRQDANHGNTTSRTRQLVDTLNETLGRGEHKNMFHHGDDAGNPVSAMGDNFPATFYLPQAMEHRVGGELMRFDEICVVPNEQSFKTFVACIKENGYHFNAHPDWQVPKSPKFNDALAFFQGRV